MPGARRTSGPSALWLAVACLATLGHALPQGFSKGEAGFISVKFDGTCVEAVSPAAAGDAAPHQNSEPEKGPLPRAGWDRAWFMGGACLNGGFRLDVSDSDLAVPCEVDAEAAPTLERLQARRHVAVWDEADRGRTMASVCAEGVPLEVTYQHGEKLGVKASAVPLEEWCRMYLSDRWVSASDAERKLSAPYVRNMKMKGEAAQALMGALRIPILSQNLGSRSSFWMAPRSMYTDFHSDTKDNIQVLVAGRKRWWLVHPAYTPYLNDRLERRKRGEGEREQLELAELRRLRSAGGRVLEVEIEGGQAVFVPKGWGHLVVNLEDSVATNTWFQPSRPRDAEL
eukprot:TRINITY_DN23782_c0_g1_i1.p1 TRINITY_DN23782_c0_g1~~TRINITY_DN23782_c0_g1_i1.p1  ORF type:complete len:341 (+),score=43.94 TRINITY_DN23782_c0_g1_i1:188-1210(+)